jgi:diadenosine tetraphosphatase ApaH/serine/threonine PP2A family protein phosphatase
VRVALLSDIHANLDALDACLAHAGSLEVDRYAFLGDYVGYGADATGVVERVAEFASRGHIVVKGNHDDALEHPSGYFNHEAQAALEWARRTLTPGQRDFLDGLPLVVREAPLCLVHASVDRPERWEYVDSAPAAVRSARAAEMPFTFCGHVHLQRLYFETSPGRMKAFQPNPGTPIPVTDRRQWLVVVGSVGQPRDRRTSAGYAVFDTTRGEITFFRIPYDAHSAADKIRRAGLPDSLAYRVESGI